MKKYKIVALMGKAGSGKDTLLQNLVDDNKGFNEIISCTTRPPREGEKDGVNYFFLDPGEFAARVLAGEMVEAAVFRDWVYGTSFDSLSEDRINIGVFNPTGIETMLSNKNIDLQIFYIICNDKERLIRQLNRESNPDIEEIFRRYKTDEEDFWDLDFDFISVYNETEDDLWKAERTIMDNIV